MKIIGIDLGTTNSVVCEYSRGETAIVKIDGKPTVPSVVHIDEKGTVEVGEKAKRKVFIHPESVLSSMKRHIGTDYTKKIQGHKYTPVEAACHVLSHLKEQAQSVLNDTIQEVVITVPAYFNEEQRKDTKKAAEKAGLDVLRLLPEPTAAAIAYGLNKEKDQTILVFDLGGGTFDVSILEVRNNNFIVKAVDGNSQLGGDDFDNAIVEYLNNWIEENTGQSVRGDQIAQQKLKEEAEKAKIDLAQAKSTEINIPGVIGGVDVEVERFTRKAFENLIEPYLTEIKTKTSDVIGKAGLSIDDINRIVLVGGSSKHPVIEQLVADNFKQPYRADDMDTFVARGAAIVCGSQVTPGDLTFKDVIPHSLGVDMMSGKKLVFVPILNRNTHYPSKSATLGMRQHKWQEEVHLTVFRGEDKEPSNNTKLGQLEMEISSQYRGQDIDVVVGCIFELDHDGILTFTAVEIPVTADTIADIQAIGTEREANGTVSYDSMMSLINKHSFVTKKVEIKGGLI